MSNDIERWQKILEYYRACISAENIADSKFRLANDGKGFFLVEEECISQRNNILAVDERNPRFRSFMQATRWSTAPAKYFYGFPCQVDNRKMLHPLIVFDVELEQTTDGREFVLEPNQPRPNLSWLGFGITPDEKRQAIEEFNDTWDERRALLDNVDEVLQKWEAIFPYLDRHTLLHNPFGVLFHSIQSPYTKGLEQELTQLSTKTRLPNKTWALILDRNGLPIEEDAQDILEITPLNDEQRRAIKSAFVNTLTIVTGPPGTGKSQVILNVIVNALQHNETVLFGSKNHKAVDVVIERLSRMTSQPIILKYGNQELEFAEELLQAVEYATAQNSGVIANEIREYKQHLDRVHREEQQAKQTLERIVDRRNRIEDIENNLESIAATDLHLYSDIASNLEPYTELSFDRSFPRQVALVERLTDDVLRIEESLASVATELDDDIAVRLNPHNELVVDESFAQKIDRFERLTERVVELGGNLTALATELPAGISVNLAPNDSLALCESFLQNIKVVDRLADDFANPRWLIKAMRKVSVFGQILARKRMVQSAQALLWTMPDYCKSLPIETHDDIQGLLVAANTLQSYDAIQRELLDTKGEYGRAAQSLLEGLPDYCVARPVKTDADLQKLLTIAKLFQSYGDHQRELLDTSEQFNQAAQSLLASLPGYCANLPIDTPGTARELAAVAYALHRYSNYQSKLLDDVELNWREPRIEVLRQRIENSHEQAIDISVKLVDALMKRRLNSLTPGERRAIVDYAQHLRALRNSHSGDELRKEIRGASEKAFVDGVARAFPAIAVTNLSIRRAVPLRREAIALVVIDEASQCDIASALPMLYRGKRALVIGDPNQLTHIANLHPSEDARLLKSNGMTTDDQRFSYIANSLFGLARTTVGSGSRFIPLVEHYRSKGEIIGFSNREFYQSRLVVHTNYQKLTSSNSTHPVKWHNVEGETIRPLNGSAYNDSEAREVVAVLQQIIEIAGAQGHYPTLGVVTPFRAQANRISDLVKYAVPAENLNRLEFVVDTAHRYQGDERDIMIFSPVISRNVPKPSLQFLDNTANLFNVAITRARAELHMVGDMKACADAGIPYLSRFVRYVEELNMAHTEEDAMDLFDSPWEKVFFDALSKAGIASIPQYRFDQYKLDLAIPDAMLNVEIDGEYWHRNLDGSRVLSDLKRDTHLFSRGWHIKRFWVYELQSDLDRCVREIEEYISPAYSAGKLE